MLNIIPLVASYLRLPELLTRRWPLEQMTAVSMPEAPVNKDDRIPFAERHVGRSGQALVMQAKAKAGSVKTPAHRHLRTGILGADAGHHPAANFRGNNISHSQREGQGVPERLRGYAAPLLRQ